MTAQARSSLLLVAAMALAAAPLSSATLDYTRVHLVDHGPTNFLFRGNMPTNDTDKSHPTFAYDTLLQYFAKRASEAGVSFPSKVYLVDISLNNAFDGADFAAEQAYWKSAPASVGKFINWPLGLAGLVPPSAYSTHKRYEMANSSVWKVDHIPERVAQIRQMLMGAAGPGGVPIAIYVHCTAGCDRTGEVIGAYRLQYQTQNLTEMYALDTSECGRSPNYFSTGALEWYCYYWEDNNGMRDIGDCTGFATCKPFGKCQPTGKNASVHALDTPPAGPPSHARDGTATPLYKAPFGSLYVGEDTSS